MVKEMAFGLNSELKSISFRYFILSTTAFDKALAGSIGNRCTVERLGR